LAELKTKQLVSHNKRQNVININKIFNRIFFKDGGSLVQAISSSNKTIVRNYYYLFLKFTSISKARLRFRNVFSS